MKAKSIKGKSTEEIQSALQVAMSDSFKPTLAICFISIKQDRKAIKELLTEKGIDVFGATSCGEFIDGYQGEGAAAILLLDIPKDCYAILFEDIGNKSLKEVAHSVAKEAEGKFTNPSLILCSTGLSAKGEFFDGTALVSTVKETLGKDRLFFGGMAGDDMTFTGSYVFAQEKETDFGIATIIFDADKINMSGMAITGWKPMGICRTVTKSSGNKIFTIDNVPAVEMYFKYLGKAEKKTDQDFKVFEELGFTYPFITEREPGGEMVLKTPMKIDHEENALVMDMDMPEGTKFWFSMPPDFDIVDEILDEAARLKDSYNSDADALLIFSCAGRQPVLGPLVTAENDGLANIWHTPMAGFFTYGEYGRTKKGKQEFHSGACCWVALKEL
ncbi:MAG: FIST C-terminal domain-containing protein [Bacteroidetes bacterium]|nr:FIST C-terminal domain-containing protein [Bacteroidota bacterium]